MRFAITLTFITFVLIAMLPRQGAAQIDPSDVVAAWLFEEGDGDIALDSSLNGNDGILLGGVTWEEEGVFGGAVAFDGIDNSKMEASTDGFPVGGDDRTIAFWVKSPNFAVGNTMLAGWGNSAAFEVSSVVMGLFDNPDGVLGFWGWNADVIHPPPPPEEAPRLEADRWYHVAVTYSAGDVIIYLDGNVWAEGTISLLNTPADTTFWLADWSSIMKAFLGIFDEVVVLTAALSQDDVAELIDEGLESVLGGPPFRVTCRTTPEGTIVGETVGVCGNIADLLIDDVAAGNALVIDGSFETPIPGDCSPGEHTLTVVCRDSGLQALCNFECGLLVTCEVTAARALSVQTSISGAGGACASVDLMIDGNAAGSAAVGADGTFETPLPSPCTPGEHTLSVACLGSGLSATCTFICGNINPATIVGAWLFDEGAGDVAGDSSESGNDGMLVDADAENEDGDTKPTWEEGVFGSAVSFDGLDDSMQAPTDGFPTGAGDRTIAFWVRSPNVAVGNGFLAGYGLIAAQQMSALLMGINDSPVRKFAFWSGSGTGDLEARTLLQNDTWYHVAMTLEENDLTLYLNGEVERQARRVLSTPADQTLQVAGYSGGLNFQGTFDEVVVLNVAVDQNNIRTLMQGIQTVVTDDPVCQSKLRCTVNLPTVEVRWNSGFMLANQRLVINGGAPIALAPDANSFDIPSADLTPGDNTIELLADPGCSLSCQVDIPAGLTVTCRVTPAQDIEVKLIVPPGGVECDRVDLSIDDVPAGTVDLPPDGIFETPVPSNCPEGEHTLGIVCRGSGLSTSCTFNCGAIDPSDMVAAWLFDEGEGTDVEDASDNGNDGLLLPDEETGPTWEEGVFGGAVRFDGINDSMEAFTDGFPTADLERTIAFWVKSPNMAQSNKFLAGWGNPAGLEMSSLVMGLNDQPSRKVAFWGFGNDVAGVTEMQDNTWYHVAFVLDGPTATLYVNGEVEVQLEIPPLLTPPDTTFFVANFFSVMGPFQGSFDEMVIFGVPLDQNNIKVLMQGAQSLFGGPVCPSNLRCNLSGANVEVRWSRGLRLNSLQLVINGGAPTDLDPGANAVDIPIGDLNQEGDNTIELRATPGCATLSCQVGASVLFRRGDHDGSGAVDITDSLNRLGFLFLGTTPSECQDASDFDNSGAVDISDSLNELTFLFLGTVVPPPPGINDCGIDPTEVLPANGGLPEQAVISLGCDTYPSANGTACP
jgi:hypothetical protein